MTQIRVAPHEDAAQVWQKHLNAFSVERVTKAFFRDYSAAFEEVRGSIKGIRAADERHLFTQTLFNRLMFCWFLQKKGWLNHEPDYFTRRLADAKGKRQNFYADVLYYLFFWAMNTPTDTRMAESGRAALRDLIGNVPFLNGGLFEMGEWDARGKVEISNTAFDTIFHHLFGRYNFTVEESTPLDVRVAVDPEMLGKVFEELVIERHAQGSYYTPRNVVQFMCREALKAYLTEWLPDRADAVTALVEEHDVSGLTVADAKRVATALETVRVCDPACGSGAYLVGMLHELVDLSTLIYNPALRLEPRTLYDHKLNVIQNNLYGVDMDLFAVNIAMLRLWLSLAVDHDVTDIADVQPLPNLNFKIQRGDSLTAPDPQAIPNLFRAQAAKVADELAHLKADFLRETGERKVTLRKRIEKQQAELADTLRNIPAPPDACDWRIAFAELFAGKTSKGGFDIVITNPPYVNTVVTAERPENYAKDLLRGMYESASGAFDLFVVFQQRSIQLLRPGGCSLLITPNKYLSAEYATALRRWLLENAEIHSLVDLSRIKVFEASVYPVITIMKRRVVGQLMSVPHIAVWRADESDEEHQSIKHVVDADHVILTLLPDYLWSPLLHESAEVLQFLENTVTIDSIAEVCGAATVSEAYDWKASIVESSQLSRAAIDSGRYARFIVSGNIDPFRTTWTTERVQYIKRSYTQPFLDLRSRNISARRHSQIRSPKVIVSGMGLIPEAFYDDGHYAAGKSTVLILDAKVDLRFICGLLNSDLYALLYSLFFESLALSGGYLRFGPPQIGRLPILISDHEAIRTIAQLVAQIQQEYENPSDDAPERVKEWLRDLNDAVFNLYGIPPQLRMAVESWATKRKSPKGKRQTREVSSDG